MKLKRLYKGNGELNENGKLLAKELRDPITKLVRKFLSQGYDRSDFENLLAHEVGFSCVFESLRRRVKEAEEK